MERVKLVFFSMPFGTKFVGDGPHNFDETWQVLLKAAVPEGWDSKRIDEVEGPGRIPEQFKEFLRTADVVVFDVTSANPNVLYELGIRDVFAPGRRVLVARAGTTLPFNIAAERVLHYAADRDTALAEGFPQRLRQQILQTSGGVTKGPRSAPEEARLRSQLERATNVPSLVALWQEWKTFRWIAVDPLLQLARLFGQHRRLDLAVEVARRAYQEAPSEWEVARTLGWYLRRSGAHEEAGKLLRQALALNPADVESMGMLGGLYKRKALEFMRQDDQDGARTWFRQSREMYTRALAVDPNDIYSLVNAGASAFIDGDKQPQAYRRVIQLVSDDHRSTVTWDLLALGEASLVLGMREQGLSAYSSAVARTDFNAELGQSASEQLKLLEHFGLPTSYVADARSILIGEVPGPNRSIVLVHLSDVHFGKKPTATGEVDMHRFRKRSDLHDPRTLAQHIVDECAAEVRSGAAVFIAISGDTAYQAIEREYSDAGKFVKELLEGLGLGLDRLIIVPGNHDVNWKLSGLEKSLRFDTYLTFADRVYGDLFRAIYPFVTWDFKVGSQRPEPHQILSIHRSEKERIVFVGFNSCALEDDTRHFGAIGKQQLNHADELLKDVDPSWVRVAVMHHHVLPLESRLSLGQDGAEMDATLVRDYSLVERELHRLGFDLVLHGHKHEPGVRVSQLVNAFGADGGKSLIVCGAGSAGVERQELPDDWGNHFAIYRIRGPRRVGEPFVDIEWRELPYNDMNRSWVRRGRWSVKG
jgi:3',5'-cyclic AMP phosphodiesterase CpdA